VLDIYELHFHHAADLRLYVHEKYGESYATPESFARYKALKHKLDNKVKLFMLFLT